MEFRVDYYQKRTNGMVFDRECRLVTEIDYPDLYYYDRDSALWACEFIETVGTITEDGHNFKKGDKVKLLDWQIQTICNFFGVKRLDNNLRRYWSIVHLLPKKQGKSPFSAFMALFLMAADGQGTAEIFTVACDRAQAGIIHGNAKKLVKASSYLMEILRLRTLYIEHLASESRFWVTSTVEESKHGPNLSAIFFDEGHAYARWKLVETLSQGIAARPEPAIVHSSTAGVKGTPFHRMVYKNAKGLLNKTIRNDTELVFIYEADEKKFKDLYGESWEGGKRPWWAMEEVWADVNPSYGVTVTKQYFENEVTMIKNGTRSLNKFLQMHLNIFTGETEGWDIGSKWVNLVGDRASRRGWGGIYVGKPQEMTCACFYSDDGWIDQVFFMPEDYLSIYRAENAQVDVYIAAGVIKVIPGNYIGIDEHLSLIRAYFKPYHILSMGFRAGDDVVGEKLCKDGGYEQRRVSAKGSQDWYGTMRHFEDLVQEGKVRHRGAGMMAYQIEMTEIESRNDDRRPSAQKSNTNICGVYASLLAAHGEFKGLEEARGFVDGGIAYVPNVF